MKLIEVSPITDKVAKDSLTYFSSKDIKVGDIVSIDIRKKSYDALVVAVDDVQNRKIDVKGSDFALRKVREKRGAAPFYREFFEGCRAARDFSAGNLGQIISYFIPSSFLEAHETLPKPAARTVGSTVFHIAPTLRAAEKLFTELLRSDLNNVFLIHGSLRKKKLLARYAEILNSKDPVMVVMTPSFLFTPRHDLSEIIIHDEGNAAYRTIKRPYFDLRVFARQFAEKMNIKLTFDNSTTLETLSMQEPFLHENKVSGSTCYLKLVDMSDKEERYKKSFIFSNDVFEAVSESKHAFLFSLKKGLASSVVCHDCGHILKDGDTPLALRERGGQRILINPLTNTVLDTRTRCPICESWNFDSFGIGTDTVTEEAKRLFPKKETFQIDGDVVKTDKKVRELIEKFYASDNAILVGTELALSYVEKPLDVAAIISMDALLSLPSFRVYERMLRLALAVGKLSDNAILQTREPNTPAIMATTSGNLQKFYDSERDMRQKFGYPPFGTIIRLSRTSPKDDYDRVAAPLLTMLADWSPLPRRIKRGKAFETIIVLKLAKHEWNEAFQNPNLSATLSSLGPDWQIRINPEML